MDHLSITSVQNAKVKELVALQRAKGRRQTGRTLAEGIHLAQEAFSSGCTIDTVVVRDDALEIPEIAALLDQADVRDIHVWELSEACYRKISDLNSPEGIAVVLAQPACECSAVMNDPAARLLVAAGVQDPGNAGALVRVAEATGVSACVFLDGIDITHPRFLRASMGSAFRVPCVAATTDEFYAHLQQHPLRVLVADANVSSEDEREPQPYDTVSYAAPLAICVGGEGQGIPAPLLEAATEKIYLPMRGKLESLNVAVAAGVLCYHASHEWE